MPSVMRHFRRKYMTGTASDKRTMEMVSSCDPQMVNNGGAAKSDVSKSVRCLNHYGDWLQSMALPFWVHWCNAFEEALSFGSTRLRHEGADRHADIRA